MKMLFLQNLWVEQLGPMYISAALKKNGHDCDVLISDGDAKLHKKILKIKPDLIAFSCTTGVHRWALEIAKNLKDRLKLNIPIIMGGPHPTHFPEVINNPGIDIVVRGEGEGVVVDLAQHLDKNEDLTCIPNVWVKKNGKIFINDARPLIEDLDTMPFPDRELYYKYDFLRKNPIKNFITSRGCPYRCSFCFNGPLRQLYKDKGRFVRRRSVDNVIKELKDVKGQYGFKTAEIEDDIFIMDKNWFSNFSQRYKDEIGLPYSFGVRADLIDDDIAYRLKESGCRWVYFGIESGNESIRNNIIKKDISNEEIINCAKSLKRHGVPFGTFNMVGIPGETTEDAMQTILINQIIKTDYPWCSIAQLTPRTELAEYALTKGVIDKDLSIDENPESYFKSSMLKQDNIRELINLQKFFYLAVKFPSLLPVIKLLIKLPTNPIFDFIFILGYGLQIRKRTGIGPVRLFMLGTKLWRHFIRLS